MKVLGKNTMFSWSRPASIRMTVNLTAGCFTLSEKLVQLLCINRSEGIENRIVFIDDENGKLGIAKTDDKEKGFSLNLYDDNTRCRFASLPVAHYIIDFFRLNRIGGAWQIIFADKPETIDGMLVLFITKVEESKVTTHK